jgi:hypothetical protein
MLFTSNPTSFQGLYKSGEFFLYGVSLLGSSLLVYRNFKAPQESWLQLWEYVILIFIVCCSLAYVAVVNISEMDFFMVKIASIISLLVAIPSFYHSQVVNKRHKAPDVGDIRRDEQETIENALS